MGSINANSDDKEWFDEFKGDRNQAEAFAEMVQIVKTFEGEPVDEEELSRHLEQMLAPQMELAAFRGMKEAAQKYIDDRPDTQS